MKKLLTSPVKMNLNELENQHYQLALKCIAPISLNLLAVKVDEYPESFLEWCKQLYKILKNKFNQSTINTINNQTQNSAPTITNNDESDSDDEDIT